MTAKPISRFITREIVAEIINHLSKANFDTHEIEEHILRHHTVAFARQLLQFEGKVDPWQLFSADFSKWMGREFKNEITKSTNRKKLVSRDVGGGKSKNQEWTIVDPGTPII